MTEEASTDSGVKTAPPVHGVGDTGQMYKSVNETRPASDPIPKNKLKRTKGLMLDSKPSKSLKKIIGIKSRTFLVAIFFLIYLLGQGKQKIN